MAKRCGKMNTLVQMDSPIFTERFKHNGSTPTRQAHSAMTEVDHYECSFTALWATEPVDKVNQTLQHADCAGNALLDAIRKGGTIEQCEAGQL